MHVTFARDGLTATVEGASNVAAAGILALLEEFAAGPVRAVVIALMGDGARHSTSDLGALSLAALPTVAALTGTVSGGTSEVALACDIRIAARGARIELPAGSARAGVLAPGMTGVLDAPTSLAAGLVSEVADDAEALGRAQEVAAIIASKGPIATRLAKEAVWRGLPMPLAQALRLETDLTLLLQTTKDRAEGVRAFLEKRPPAFTGE